MEEAIAEFKVPIFVAKDSVKMYKRRSPPFIAPCEFSILQVYSFEAAIVYCIPGSSH